MPNVTSLPPADGDNSPLDLLGAGAALLRHAWLVAGLPLTLAGLVVLAGVLWPRSYTVSVTFMPSSQTSSVSQLVGLAAQFGLTGGGGGSGSSDSPDFYADLIRSDVLLRAVVVDTFSYQRDGVTHVGNLMAAFDEDSTREDLMVARTIVDLRARLSANPVAKTGVVDLAVTTHDPALSLQIAERVLRELDRFNRDVRRSQAGEERQFVESRVDSALLSLRAAEDRLQAFLTRNRSFQSSPELMFAHDRLQRDISASEALYTSLLQGYEQAKMEEVRTTPVITVVQPPVRPARPDSRHLALRAVLTMVLGLLMSIALAFGLDGLRRSWEGGATAADEVRQLWGRRQAELMGWLAWFRRKN